MDFVSPSKRAMDLIRKIGDKVSESNEPIENISLNDAFSLQIFEELVRRGVISAGKYVWDSESKVYLNVNLTLEGWEQFEQEKRGKFKGNYGFIAMQFNDPELDPFIANIVKPKIKFGFGYDLVDMRDVAQAGLIDNIMRVQIRDAAFVIVDLTHDNHGAYWEAGYAEGLGKPVVYICEQTKFKNSASHFDTNHCTTITWSKDNSEGFMNELIATLRRSLDDSS